MQGTLSFDPVLIRFGKAKLLLQFLQSSESSSPTDVESVKVIKLVLASVFLFYKPDTFYMHGHVVWVVIIANSVLSVII